MIHFFNRFLPLSKKNKFTILGLAAAFGLACGGGDYFWYDFSNIHNSSFVPSEYSFFGFNPNAAYDDFIENNYEDSNVLEWKGFLGEKYHDTIVWSHLYQKSTSELCEDIKKVKDKKNKWFSFLNYLIQAKRAEEYGNGQDGWYYHEYSVKKDSVALAQELTWQTMFIEEKHPFIQQRLLFQLVRNAFFSGNGSSGVAFFEKYKNDFPQNNMYWRTHGYAAGCYHKLKQYALSNAMYVKMMSVDRMYYTQAHYSFHPLEERDFEECLSLCSTKEEKINAWVLAGLYNDPERALVEIVKIDPSSVASGLFVSRIVTEAENEIRGFWESPQTDYDFDSKISYLKQFLSIPEFTEKARVLAGISYLLYLQGSNATAETFLEKAFVENNMTDELLHRQLLIFKAIFDSKDIYSCSSDELKNLHALTSQNTDYGWSGYLQTIIENIDQTLQLKKHDLRVFVRPSIQDLKDVSLLMRAKADAEKGDMGSDLRKLILGIDAISLEELTAFIAVHHTLNDNLDEAQHFAHEVKSNQFNFIIYGDPFSFRLKDCHDCDHQEYKGPFYNMKNFVDSLEIKKTRFKKKNDFKTALEIGNAFYNTSYYGNARLFGYVPWPKYGFHYKDLNDSWWDYQDDMRINYDADCVDKARVYWTKALQLASTNEEKALATFLLSKCELIAYYFNKSPEDKSDFKAGIYFQELLKYKETKQFKEVIQECGYFTTYYSTKN